MIRIAVVEDDPQSAKQLLQYLHDFQQETGHPLSVTTYSDGDMLVAKYKGQFDLILMDIEMPLLNGMTAAEIIRQSDQEVAIIFVTIAAQHAIQGYAVDALDYILKPVNYFSFANRLQKAVRHIQNRKRFYLTISIKGGIMKVEAKDLYYVESQGHQLCYHTRDGIYVSPGTIQQAEEKLAGQGFFRCNKGYLVNLEHVDGVQDGCVMVNGERLLISRSRKTPFLEALADYIGEMCG